MASAPGVLLFDDGTGDLGPLSDLRASFEQRTGGLALLERVGAGAALAVPEALEAVVRERHGEAAVRLPAGPVLCVNGRFHAPIDAGAVDASAAGARGVAVRAADGSVAAALLAGPALEEFVRSVRAGNAALPAGCEERERIPASASAHLPGAGGPPPLWSRPWHLLDTQRLTALVSADADAAARRWAAAGEAGALPAHAARVGGHPLHLHATAVIGVGVVFDTSAGPVCVGPGAQVGHQSVVQGPAWIGPKSIVAPGALLKERTVLGPQCRAAGEIGSAIFQACSNKAHDGHLGDALLGEWVNLGAGTVNSNLLNTYGEVAMRLRPGASMERTGRQFMGCVIGDHAKTAIGTRIMTGSSIGTGAMWAAGRAVSGAVAPFAWVTDDGERRFRLDKFQEIARTVMARRGAEPGPATAARLAALHAAAGG
jgi:UDP-N-acetylglucosamine diphosphorylase/glucosamine-1-phosphate N-acetyltransferase